MSRPPNMRSSSRPPRSGTTSGARHRTRERRIRAGCGGLLVGFLSSAVLILSRGGFGRKQSRGGSSPPSPFPSSIAPITGSPPPTGRKDADIMTVGAAESIFSGLSAIPSCWSSRRPGARRRRRSSPIGRRSRVTPVDHRAHRLLHPHSRERRGLHDPGGLCVDTGGGALGDPDLRQARRSWIWVSLAILMVALWLNNSRRRLAL